MTFTGMLSKGKGQCLRIAAKTHVLFQITGETIGDDVNIVDEVSDQALKAAIDLSRLAFNMQLTLLEGQPLQKKLSLLNAVCVDSS